MHDYCQRERQMSNVQAALLNSTSLIVCPPSCTKDTNQVSWTVHLQRSTHCLIALLASSQITLILTWGFKWIHLTTDVNEIVSTEKENWNNLINYLKNKDVLVSHSSSVVSGPTVAPSGNTMNHPNLSDQILEWIKFKPSSLSGTPPKFVVDGALAVIGRVSCGTTSAAKQGIAQNKFDEVNCISPEYITGFRTGKSDFSFLRSKCFKFFFSETGEFDWYELLLKRFEKKS